MFVARPFHYHVIIYNLNSYVNPYNVTFLQSCRRFQFIYQNEPYHFQNTMLIFTADNVDEHVPMTVKLHNDIPLANEKESLYREM